MKKNKYGRCVHCLKWSTDITDDHVLPKHWYIINKQSSEEKWKVPACLSCNGKLGPLERDLFIRLALCANLINDYIVGARDKVLNMLNPDLADNPTEAGFRRLKIEALLKDTVPSDGSTQGLFPNFKYHTGYDTKDQKTLKIPKRSLVRFGEKLVRGIEYKMKKRYITDNYSLEVMFVDQNKILHVIELMKKFGSHYYHAQGFEFRRASPTEEDFPVLFQIRIWDYFEVYASLNKKN